MALSTMYDAQPNSPQTTLAGDITAADTSMTLADASVLPAAPNICTIGDDENAEVVIYGTITGNVVSNLIRGSSGTTASVWPTGTYVARDYTSYDHDTFIDNITDLDTSLNGKAPLASPAFTGTPTAPTASASTNTQQIATTAFVHGRGCFYVSGSVSVGSSTTLSNASITSSMRPLCIFFGTPANIKSDVTCTTASGSITLSGTFIGSSTVQIILAPTDSITVS